MPSESKIQTLKLGINGNLTACAYDSPIGQLLLASDDAGLVGLWLDREHCPIAWIRDGEVNGESAILLQTRRWLDIYFSSHEPPFTPLLHMMGTPFQMLVWRLLLGIGYGETTTYGALASAVARESGKERMSAQAIGSAVGRNPISLIVPCHRVIGANGALIGYGGGLDKKAHLLELEQMAQPLRD